MYLKYLMYLIYPKKIGKQGGLEVISDPPQQGWSDSLVWTSVCKPRGAGDGLVVQAWETPAGPRDGSCLG